MTIRDMTAEINSLRFGEKKRYGKATVTRLSGVWAVMHPRIKPKSGNTSADPTFHYTAFRAAKIVRQHLNKDRKEKDSESGRQLRDILKKHGINEKEVQ
jgi:hypothetical protein